MSSSALLAGIASYLSPSSIFIGTLAAFTLFILARCIYRVTFHPLAAFPGPRLAALTSLYGAFYDLLPNRSYCKHFSSLHDRYGPIVRLWPDHLHIRDIDAYNQIFKIGTKFEKHGPFYSNPSMEGSYFIVDSNKPALARKAMHAPLFSKEVVRRSEFLITDLLVKFLGILSGYVSESRPVDLTFALKCLTADISMDYAFQKPLNALDAEAFRSEVVNGVLAFYDTFHWPTYFPKFFGGVYWVVGCLPQWFLSRFLPPFAHVNWCLKVSREQIVYLQKRSSSEKKIRSVFDINLNPNIEKGQFTPTIEEMAADAFLLMLAGTDTVANTTVNATWALLNNPQMMQRLKAELRGVIPGREDVIDWAELEKLPYLHAIIQEGLRCSIGVPGRIPRIVPPEGAIFCGQKIPAGTLVSSSAIVYHQDLQTFPDPQTFRPERWLADSESKELEKKFMPFSRGSRNCVGSNLAYAELHLIIAHLFRRFDVSNGGTTDADMEWDDCFVPKTRGHLKVVLKESME